MISDLFVGDINSLNLVTLQNWCGAPLDRMNFVDTWTELINCRNKVVFLDAQEANFKFDETKKIIENGNYVVLIELNEVVSFALESLKKDLPSSEQFPRIIGGISAYYTDCDGRTFVDERRKKDFNLDSFYFLTHTDTNILKAVDYTRPFYLDKKNKPYKFLFLNGKHRLHRERLWKLLEQRGLISQGLCSYLKLYDPRTGYQDPEIPVSLLPKEYESLYRGIDTVPAFKNDERNWKVFKHDYWRRQWVDSHVIPQQYIDTYFTVVTETWCDRVFLTEKIFKPLMAGHPFLVLAAPGYYEYLHDLGFRTFDGIIDESFSREPNLEKRIEMLAREVQRLSESDLDEFVEKTKSICKHNQDHYINSRQDFFRKKHFDMQKFIKQVEVDAQTYFQQLGDNNGSI